MSATDGDIGMNADITFHIVDGSEGKLIIARKTYAHAYTHTQ